MPITSTDFDNAEIDLQTTSIVSNSKTLAGAPTDSTLTRLGDTVDTLNGRLKKLGYLPPVAYVGGIAFTALDNVKTVEESGSRYAPRIDSLPFTTSGTWIGDDENKFYLIEGAKATEISAEFETVADMVNGVTTSGTTIDWATYEKTGMETVYNNLTSKDGGAKYIKKTVAQAAADGDVVDGTGAPNYYGANHALAGGTHVAVLQTSSVIDALTCGLSTGNTPSQNTQVLDITKAAAISFGLTPVVSSGSFEVDAGSLYDLYDIGGRAILIWNGNSYSLESQNKRQSSYEELGQKCRSGSRVVVGFFGDSTVRGIGTTGGTNPPLTGTAPNIAPVAPVGDLNIYSPEAMPQRFEEFAQILFDNPNIVGCNGAYGGAAASNAFPVQYLDDIFLNNTTTDFQEVDYMLINFAYNDANFFTDTVDNYKLYMGRLAKKCRGFGIEPIFMTADPAINTGSHELLEVKGQLKNALYEVAKELGVDVLPIGDDLINFYESSSLASWGKDQPDGVHIDSRGHRAKVQSLLKYIAGNEIFSTEGRQSELNISPMDDRCKGLSKTIGEDSIRGQSNLFFGTNHRISTSGFTAGQLAIDAWIWCDSPQALLFHMMTTNEYETTTLQSEIPYFLIDNMGVNFDPSTQKTVYASDCGRPTFGDRIDERPCLVTRIRYGLNRVRLISPNPARITYTHWQTGFLRVVNADKVGAKIEGKDFDLWGAAGRSTARMYRNIRPTMIIPTVSPVTQSACFATGNVNASDTDMMYTPDTVVDFKAKLYQDTGITFGGGVTQPVNPQGYCIRLTASSIVLSRIQVDRVTSVPTILDLLTTPITIGEYDGQDNSYRIYTRYPSTIGIGCVIEFFKYSNGVPQLVFSWNSESAPSKECISAAGLIFGGFWDASAGSSGETLEITAGTVYSRVT